MGVSKTVAEALEAKEHDSQPVAEALEAKEHDSQPVAERSRSPVMQSEFMFKHTLDTAKMQAGG